MKRRKITVAIADDHTMFRQCLRECLEAEDHIDVAAEADDGRNLIAECAGRRIDVAVLDLTMPRLNGVETARRLAATSPATRTVMLTMHAEAEFLFQALDAGVHGFVLKSQRVDEIVQAISEVNAGRTFVTSRLTRALIDRNRTQGTVSPLVALTPREHETLQLLADGSSVKQAAAAMGLNNKTVHAFKSALMTKLEIDSIQSLVKFAITHGLTTADSYRPNHGP